jgi:chromosome segregation ATPase
MNKIKEDQLSKLVSLNQDLRHLKNSIADTEIQISRAKAQIGSAEAAKLDFISRIENCAKELTDFQQELSTEYGNVVIDLQTGEYKNG